MTTKRTLILPDDFIDEAHKIYKAAGGKYARTGGFCYRGPLRAVDNDLWMETLNELKDQLLNASKK